MPEPPRSTLAAGGLIVPIVFGGLGLGRPAAGAEPPLEPGLEPAPEVMAMDRWLAPLGPTALADARGSRGLWLSVGGGVTASPGERQRVFGLVELGLGLEGGLHDPAGALASTEAGAPELRGEPGAPDEAALFPAAAEGAGQPDPRAAAVALASTPGAALGSPGGPAATLPGSSCAEARSCDPASIAGLARAVVAEALRVQGSARELSRLDGMAARSRAAASLPEVRLGAGTSRDESLRQNPTVADPARFTRDGGRDLWLEARLTWRLDSAIFASDEIAIMRLRAQQREDAARLSREVLEALIDWQRSRLVLASEAALPEQYELELIRQFGAVARLDVLTDGWFSRYLARAPRSHP